MSYLIIDKISLFDIQLHRKNKNKYNIIYYFTKNIKSNGLLFKTDNIFLKINNFYFLKIVDINLLKIFNTIDKFLYDKINNYTKFIKKINNSHGIIFNLNHITNMKYNYYMNNINENIYLNLKYINNNYNNNNIPIIHLL